MSDMTVAEVIHTIAPAVKIHDTPMAFIWGGGMYNPQLRVVFVRDQKATDGWALGAAVHESFHAVRHEQHVPFFGLAKPSMWQRFAEERRTNDLAEPWIRQHLPADKQKDALAMIGYSRFAYTPLGQVYVIGKNAITLGLPFFLVCFFGGRWLGKQAARRLPGFCRWLNN